MAVVMYRGQHSLQER
uniref:Uncharacterized protein n=1 Tax=Arundo donax TaxID=35708 RepID=A0A0A9AQJ0_ARUDO